MKEYSCELCEDTGVTKAGESCAVCCEHAELDHGICMDCGIDRTEDLMAKAYDYFKDRD